MRIPSCICFGLLACTPFVCSAEEGHPIEGLLDQSCLDCHDGASKKGDLSLEDLNLEINDRSAEVWLLCLEQIERGFMPPARKKQPTPEERETAIRDLESRLVAFHGKKERHPAVLRRLNQAEYRNSLRDLFQINLGSDDPSADFPADQLSHGFASNGEHLVTSNFLFQKQLEAAESVVNRAIHFEPKPELKKLDLKPPFDRTTKGQNYGDAAFYRKKAKETQPFQSIYTRPSDLPKGGYHPIDELNQGVSASGWYNIRIQVEAKFRHSLDQSKFKQFPSMWDETEPLRLSLFTGTLKGIDPANTEARDYALTHQQGNERDLATWDLPDDKLVWLDCKVWLDEGHFPRFTFPNGPTDSNNRLKSYCTTHAEALLSPEAFKEYQEIKPDGWNVLRYFETPRINLHRIEIEGSLYETWPPESHRAVFGDKPYHTDDASEVLAKFASRAWRRPVAPEEITVITGLVRESEKNGLSAEAAIQEGLKAVICSPGFLYREERGEKLTAHELATRLSYFLTASMPDETLTVFANKGRIPLHEEAERLLKGESSDAFIDEFLNGWLRLSKLGSMSPDVQKYGVYYSDMLEPAMRTETRLFFKQLLATNGGISNFLDSDYTFVNRELADLYSLDFDGEKEEENIPGLDPSDLRRDFAGDAPSLSFARIPLKNRLRGGLLGQASVLTLTANGVDTSPVIRGVWLLENILGTPPSPPPPNIPVIEPDIRGATTIRNQLEKHRESKACSSCHAHIDPPGFALESFDPIGKWRGHYIYGAKGIPIDSSGSFSGQDFKDILGFKDLLLGQQDLFARNLVEKLFIHALGRDLEVTDRPYIRSILTENKAKGYRLKDLVLAVVESPLFQDK